MMGRPPEERMLQLLDELCLDSLEGLASEQKPEHGEISARFHELRGLVLARGRVIEAARRHVEDEAADAVAVQALETAENVTFAQQHQRGTRQRADESFGLLCAALAAEESS